MKKSVSLLCVVMCFVTLLSSCGGASVSLYVTQSSTTLIVDGGRYERRPDLYECGSGICVGSASRAQYASGQVLVVFAKPDAQEGAFLINRLGLSIIEVHDDAERHFLTVAVPTLFEEQWVQAFRSQPLVMAAHTNDIIYSVNGDVTADDTMPSLDSNVSCRETHSIITAKNRPRVVFYQGSCDSVV